MLQLATGTCRVMGKARVGSACTRALGREVEPAVSRRSRQPKHIRVATWRQHPKAARSPPRWSHSTRHFHQGTFSAHALAPNLYHLHLPPPHALPPSTLPSLAPPPPQLPEPCYSLVVKKSARRPLVTASCILPHLGVQVTPDMHVPGGMDAACQVGMGAGLDVHVRVCWLGFQALQAVIIYCLPAKRGRPPAPGPLRPFRVRGVWAFGHKGHVPGAMDPACQVGMQGSRVPCLFMQYAYARCERRMHVMFSWRLTQCPQAAALAAMLWLEGALPPDGGDAVRVVPVGWPPLLTEARGEQYEAAQAARRAAGGRRELDPAQRVGRWAGGGGYGTRVAGHAAGRSRVTATWIDPVVVCGRSCVYAKAAGACSAAGWVTSSCGASMSILPGVGYTGDAACAAAGCAAAR